MTAAVLCGGKGMRLRSTIGEHQKCAVDVGGIPWIHRVLEALAHGGAEQVVCLTGYKAEEIEIAVANFRISGPAITCLRSKPSSPEAAIQLAFATTKEKALLVVNGDTLVEGFPLAGFVAAAEMSRRTGNRRGAAVRGPSWNHGTVVYDSGIYFRCAGGTGTMTAFPTTLPFLDIGSPEGLSEARKRFS